MAELLDILSIRALAPKHRRRIDVHARRAASLFDVLLENDPDGLHIAELPLAEHPAAEHLANASSDDVISIAVSSAARLRRIPMNDNVRTISLKPPRSYRHHFAAIRVLEVSSEAGLPFELDDTKLLCAIALNAPKIEHAHDATIEYSSDWPMHAAQLITGRLLAPERMDLFDAALTAAEVLDGGLYDGQLAATIVRMGERLNAVRRPSYEVGEMYTRVQRVLAKRTSLLRTELHSGRNT